MNVLQTILAAIDNEEDDGPPGKKIDYGDFKTIKHVNTALPHKTPKTLAQHKANLQHLQKLNRNTKAQIDHHIFQHKFQTHWQNKILPLWHKMGYTANKESDLKLTKQKIKFHQKKLEHYSKLKDETKAKINQHKTAIKSMEAKPVKHKATPMQMAASSEQVLANLFPVKKDANYYKRLAKLFHLKIDSDVSKTLTLARSKSGAEITSMYNHEYHAHPLFKHMHRAIKKAAKLLSNPLEVSLPY